MLNKNNRKSSQFVPNWSSNSHYHVPKATSESTKTSSIHEESLDMVSSNDLRQGELYIIKAKLIAIALFQGWDDEMCCFSVLRTDLFEDFRWSEARYLPENFDVFLAFDYAGNPPIHLWTKHLRAVIPLNWFNIFEEARHMQRQWHASYHDTPPPAPLIQHTNPNNVRLYELQDIPTPAVNRNDEESSLEKDDKIYYAEKSNYYSTDTSPQNEVFVDSPAILLQNEYIVTQQQQEKDLKQTEKQTNSSNCQSDKPTSTTPPSQQQQLKRPEIKQRISFSSLFIIKKKSKKSLNSSYSEDTSSNNSKRQSAPPTPSINKKYNNHQKQTLPRQENAPLPVPNLTRSNNSTISSITRKNSSPSLIVKTSDETVDVSTTSAINNKLELFDLDSYFDMQAAFAFLNNTDSIDTSLGLQVDKKA